MSTPPSGASGSGFDLNRPTIINLLYLGSFITGITGIVGVVLAYIWQKEAHDGWETSHYQWLIRTFWVGFAASIICFILMFVLIGFLLIWGVAAYMVVRCVLSMINAQKREPMPNPDSWLI
jgi:uncharacterized membrane protein